MFKVYLLFKIGQDFLNIHYIQILVFPHTGSIADNEGLRSTHYGKLFKNMIYIHIYYIIFINYYFIYPTYIIFILFIII